jgi:hypothetical protein
MKKLILSVSILAAAYTVNAQTQPPNAGMDTWSSGSLQEPQEPTGWVSANVLASPLLTFPNPNPNPTSVTADNSAPAPFAGAFSAKIVTVVLTSNPAFPTVADTLGTLMLGSVKTSTPYLLPGVSYTDKPLTFSFQSAYTAVGPDAATVFVQLSKWNTASTPASRTIITQDAAVIAPSSTFMNNSFNLTYLNGTVIPDTLQIIFSASATRANSRAGSTLLIDALAFTGINGIHEYTNSVKFSTYPNPSSAVLNLVTDSKHVDKLSILDITGREIEAVKITADHTMLNTSSYTAGVYIYTAMNSQGEIVARGKFNVIR